MPWGRVEAAEIVADERKDRISGIPKVLTSVCYAARCLQQIIKASIWRYLLATYII